MDETNTTRIITVVNPEGFHLRAATLLVRLSRQFESDISVIKGGLRVDAKTTPLQLLGLGAYQGDQITLEASGDDAEEAIDAVAELFASHFKEELAQRRRMERDSISGQCLGEDSSPGQ